MGIPQAMLRQETEFSGTSLRVDEYSATFKLVPENCAYYMLQPAESPHSKVADHQ